MWVGDVVACKLVFPLWLVLTLFVLPSDNVYNTMKCCFLYPVVLTSVVYICLVFIMFGQATPILDVIVYVSICMYVLLSVCNPWQHGVESCMFAQFHVYVC